MDIISVKTLFGPSVYHTSPVMIIKVNLAELTDTPSKDIPGFNEKLKAMLPGLVEHKCSIGHTGGFYERLETGTYLAHIIEHIAIELSQLTGIEVRYGKTFYAGTYGYYNIVVRFTNEDGMRQCLQSAFSMVEDLIRGTEFKLPKAIQLIKQKSLKHQLGPSTQTILDAAIKRNIPFRRLCPESSLFQIGYGKYRKFFQASTTDQTGLIAADIVQNKYLTKTILKRYFLPTPEGVTVSDVSELKHATEKLRAPYVVKPYDGNQGKGVVLNLVCPVELEAAFQYAKRYSSTVLVEEMCVGEDYRVLVVGGKFLAAALRKPPSIKGDGISTVKTLIEQINTDPNRGDGHESLLTKVCVDDPLISYIGQQNCHLDTVLEKDRSVVLRGNANLSSGGIAIDVTKSIHPEIQSLCERAARLVNLDICGIDLVHHDISRPQDDQTKIIEINAAPGLRMHLTAADGSHRDIGKSIMEMIYPPGERSTVPIVAVTGTNGKTTVSRLIHKILSMDNSTVGLTTTEGIWIGSDKIQSGDTTGPLSSEAVLSDPKIDSAVLEVARGGLVRGGLAYDWSDVGVITNIRADHIGQDGIESVEDLIWIKSLVAERVRSGGTLVLNADDPAAMSVLDRKKVKSVHKNIFLYSLNKLNPAFNEHLLHGGSGCWLESGYIYIKNGEVIQRLMAAAAIPITFNGIVDFQIANALAAVAASTGMGVSSDNIVAGLKDFLPTAANAGRLSLYKVHNGHVILDYGHNPDALASVSKLVHQCKGFRKTVVIGLPGDRNDELLKQCAGSIAGHFHHFIIKEDDDLRGRKSGEVSSIILRAILEKNPEAACEIVLQEKAAISKAFNRLVADELVVIFYDQLATALESLKEFDPEPKLNLPILNREVSSYIWKQLSYEDSHHFVHGTPQ